MITLGIETSCDETSAALLENERIISNAIYTQADHTKYGGVVPEIASRAHLEKIDLLTKKVLNDHSLLPSQIDLIAVTDSPGLAGALLVGVSFALGYHVSHGTAITGVNHLEGHLCSALLANPSLSFPFLALVVSGGHTAIYKAEDYGQYTMMGQTVDDAAGEAFDKVGKLLGFNYPAGRAIEQSASMATDETELIRFPIARFSSGKMMDFSFSGLKTAVKYYLSDKTESFIETQRPLICKSFQQTVINSILGNLSTASNQTGIKKIAVTGGVACNGTLRNKLQERFGKDVFFPPPLLCTDNAAMIAFAGYQRHLKQMTRFPHMDPSRGI